MAADDVLKPLFSPMTSVAARFVELDSQESRKKHTRLKQNLHCKQTSTEQSREGTETGGKLPLPTHPGWLLSHSPQPLLPQFKTSLVVPSTHSHDDDPVARLAPIQAADTPAAAHSTSRHDRQPSNSTQLPSRHAPKLQKSPD